MKTNKKNQNQNQQTNQSNSKGLENQIEQGSSTKAESNPNSPLTTHNSQLNWKGVFFNGPEPDQDREGDEIPVWTVFVGDADSNPLSRVYRVYSFAKAEGLAQAMSHDRKLELIAEAQAA